jgi:DNA-binding transcriptional LysR family regulator
MAISLRQLEVFCAVAVSRSFTSASHSLFISQSTVSQHIHELELSLGLKMFQRTRRTVALTPAAEILLERARDIFQRLEQAEIAAKTVRDPYCGRLSFGCASTTLLYHLPVILSEYMRQYPRVELRITGGSIQEVVAQIWSGALDVALVVPPLSSPALQKSMLVEEGFVWVLPSRHALAKRRAVQIQDLAEETFILLRQDQNTRKLIDRYFFSQRINPRVAAELAETEAIKAMVARGLGVSVLPESAFPGMRDKGIKTFPIPRQVLKRSLALVYPRARELRPPVMALIQLLQAHFHTKKVHDVPPAKTEKNR